jgi:FHA domain-containing protein
MTRYSRRELEIADHLWECLVRIAEDNGTDPQAVLNQAVYDLARRFNFLTPIAGQAMKASAPNVAPVSRDPGVKRPMGSQAPAKPAGGAKPTLCVVNGQGEMQKVEKDPFIIGRSRTCDLVIPSSKVSRQHCRVSRENGDYFIEDLGSPNGVWRDGVKITKERIKDGDEFMLSDEVVKFVYKTPARK